MNTPRRPEPTVDQLLAAAAEHGIDPARLLHLDEADGVAGADGAAGDLLVDYRDLTDVRLRTSLEAEHGLYIA
ncbi:MAG TPA: rRNA methyltransferase, partial [Candidatus Brevibacterium intestinigallinarum]|nr:rRNA methyltransferase [Candidatus Brevibacterium intestinigallinarum]